MRELYIYFSFKQIFLESLTNTGDFFSLKSLSKNMEDRLLKVTQIIPYKHVFLTGTLWQKRDLTYTIINFTPDLPEVDIEAAIEQAAEVSGISSLLKPLR